MGLILTTSGYRTNAGQNVWLERATVTTEAETPAIIISDGGSPPDVEGMGGNTSRWYYQLQVKFDIKATGATAGTIARKVKEDIKQAIGTDVQWGGLANGSEILADQGGSWTENLSMLAKNKDAAAKLGLALSIFDQNPLTADSNLDEGDGKTKKKSKKQDILREVYTLLDLLNRTNGEFEHA